MKNNLYMQCYTIFKQNSYSFNFLNVRICGFFFYFYGRLKIFEIHTPKKTIFE